MTRRKINEKATKRTSITVLVLGDEGVGKTSLISTFVARYFPETVSGLIPRVRLPQDPDTSSTTTIIDSQNGDAELTAKLTVSALSTTTSPSAGGVGGSSSMSSGGSSDLSGSAASAASATGGGGGGGMMMVDNVDSLILVYDLDRIETFARLEHHWLPLIERCYQGDIPVIVAANKMDKLTHSHPSHPSSHSPLLASSSEASSYTTPSATSETSATAKPPIVSSTRQQIVSIMSRYRFVRQWIKCSAKNMLRVDDIFLKAQQAVLYPITPLYDLDNGKMTNSCIQAFSRIFRMYDHDHDHLLSDYELQTFQQDAFPSSSRAVFDNIIQWKKLIARQYPNDPVLAYPPSSSFSQSSSSTTTATAAAATTIGPNPNNNQIDTSNKCFTVAGFLAIFDVFISKNNLQHCWHVLRRFGYDDDLQLQIPSIPSLSISTMTTWRLNQPSRIFLTNLFYQFDTDKDGILTYHDMKQIFSILPQPYNNLPPWHKKRFKQLFENTFSKPKHRPKQPWKRRKEAAAAAAAALVDDAALQMSPQSLSASGITILSAESIPTLATPSYASPDSSTKTSPTTSTTTTTKPKAKKDLITMTYFDWMGYWYTLSSISPMITQQELFRLGYIEKKYIAAATAMKRKHRQKKQKHGIKEKGKQRPPQQQPQQQQKRVLQQQQQTLHPQSQLPSREYKVLVIGSKGCGKTALLNSVCFSSPATNSSGENNNNGKENYATIVTDTSSTKYPESSCAYIKIRNKKSRNGDAYNNAKESSKGEDEKSSAGATTADQDDNEDDSLMVGNDIKDDDDDDDVLLVMYLIFTEIPQDHTSLTEDDIGKNNASNNSNDSDSNKNDLKQIIDDEKYSLVLFVFDSNDNSSFAYAKKIEESKLSDDNIPRMYIATKVDQIIKELGETEHITNEDDERKPSSTATTSSTANNNNSAKDERRRPTTATIQNAQNHCRELDIEPPMLSSAATCAAGASSAPGNTSSATDTNAEETIGSGKANDNDNSDIDHNNFEKYYTYDKKPDILDHIARTVLSNVSNKAKEDLDKETGIIGVIGNDSNSIIQRLKSKPHEEQRRRDAAWRRKMIWIGGIVSFGVVVAVGVKFLWGSSSTTSTSTTTTTTSGSTSAGRSGAGAATTTTNTSASTKGRSGTATTTTASRVAAGVAAGVAGSIKKTAAAAAATAAAAVSAAAGEGAVECSNGNNDNNEDHYMIGSWINIGRIIFSATTTITRSTVTTTE